METLIKDFWRGLRAAHTFQSKYAKDPKYIRESTKEHLLQLSNLIVIVEERFMTLLKDGYIPRKSTQWVKKATDLKCKVSDALKEEQKSPDELQHMCDEIFANMKDCPIEDVDAKPVAFIAPMHETDDRNLSDSNLLPIEDDLQAQDVENEEPSSDMSISVWSSGCSEGKYTSTISIPDSHGAHILKLRRSSYNMGGETMEGESSHAHDAVIPKFSTHISQVQDENKYKSKVREEGDAPKGTRAKRTNKLLKRKNRLQRRHEKMPIGMSEALTSNVVQLQQDECVARPRQTDHLCFTNVHESELHMIIPISIIGEMSVYVVDLTVEILSMSPSQATFDLNSYFGLSLTTDSYLFSAKNNPTELESDCKHLILKEMPTIDEWQRAGVVNLNKKNVILLNEELDCPNLVLLFLQRNSRLTQIPSSFFNQMPALRFLDLSDTRIKAFPSSLFKLTNLQVLLLQNCVCLDSLPAEIRNLRNLEVLDLLGTDLSDLPKGIGELTQLRHLQLSFYRPDHAHFQSELVSSSAIVNLQALQALSIVVHPKDQHWIRLVGDIIQHVGKLKKLSHLQFYFPTVEALESFTESFSWKEQRLRRFKFIVGHNIKRNISRIPNEVETKYEQHDHCLRFVNGNEVPEVMKSILNRVTAFYLDHHLEIQSLSEFDISNFKELKFCVLRECPNIQVMTIGEERTASAFPNLEYLGLHYLWKLERIWEDPVPPESFQALKYLMVSTCGKLEYIASHSILQCLSNLETFIIEDCESLKSIVKEKEMVKYDVCLLPRLSELVLRHLPQLEALGSGLFPSEEVINIHFCPKLILKPGHSSIEWKKLLGSSYKCCNSAQT
ncbi:hypothetical protein C2S51_020819 [Perilla frutescens var. frutescens]|nr:hypothetical protein C2S51_020819 [Perilla frutescens var. frutescens]